MADRIAAQLTHTVGRDSGPSRRTKGAIPLSKAHSLFDLIADDSNRPACSQCLAVYCPYRSPLPWFPMTRYLGPFFGA